MQDHMVNSAPVKIKNSSRQNLLNKERRNNYKEILKEKIKELEEDVHPQSMWIQMMKEILSASENTFSLKDRQ